MGFTGACEVYDMASTTRRLEALDILRGITIFAMILSAHVPAALPQWMHHDQFYDVNGVLQVIIGLTWVDLVFPFFLFSMGAAIPFALTRRMESGQPWYQTTGHVLWRGLVILMFSYYLGNAGAWGYGYPPSENAWIWYRTLAGFGCLVLFLGRLPWISEKPKWIGTAVKGVGLAGLVALMATLKRADGSGFTISKYDIIILVLAIDYVTASLLWMVSRKNLMLRLALIAGLFAIRFHHLAGGPILETVTNWLKPLEWGFFPRAFFHSIVVLTGTIIGDLLLNWTRTPESSETKSGLGLSKLDLGAFLTLLPALTVGGLCFLQSRYVLSGLLFTVAICQYLVCRLKYNDTHIGKILYQLSVWFTFFLIIGYLSEPMEGGIKKDGAPPSYYFVSMGMAVSMLSFFLILVDGLKTRFGTRFLNAVGSNPMLGYIAGAHLVYPIFHLCGLMKFSETYTMNSVPMGTVWAVFLTLSACLATYGLTRLKVFLRV